MFFDNFESFLVAYGYLAVLIGSFLEGETVLFLGGLAAYEGYLFLPTVLVFAWVGAVLGDWAFFFLGRYKGEAILGRFPWVRRTIAHPRKVIDRHATLVSFAVRFMYGFRNIVPFALGMSHISTGRFLIFHAGGSFLWVLVVGAAGYLFGDIMETVIGTMRRYEFAVIALILVTLAVFRLISRLISFLVRRSDEIQELR